MYKRPLKFYLRDSNNLVNKTQHSVTSRSLQHLATVVWEDVCCSSWHRYGFLWTQAKQIGHINNNLPAYTLKCNKSDNCRRQCPICYTRPVLSLGVLGVTSESSGDKTYNKICIFRLPWPVLMLITILTKSIISFDIVIRIMNVD